MKSIVPVLVIHGGAGTISPGECDADVYREALLAVVNTCKPMLADGVSSATDIVAKAVCLLEDNPLFNSGYGSVFNRIGEHECDASMAFVDYTSRSNENNDQSTAKGAAGVAGLKKSKNPILVARAVMEKTPVALMIGSAADQFGFSCGLTEVENTYFSTERRVRQLREVKAEMGEDFMSLRGEFVRGGPDVPNARPEVDVGGSGVEEVKRGTVGAVAMDFRGNIAAATSTGGLTNKMPGRVGDSACIGHGTIADERSGVAVSCTGTGEAFMRACAASSVASYVRFHSKQGTQTNIEDVFKSAVLTTINEEVPAWGGDGGLIAVMRLPCDDSSAPSAIALTCFNTPGMYRGVVRGDESSPEVAVFGASENDVMSIDVLN